MSSQRLGRLEVQIAGSHVTFVGRIDDASALAELASQIPPGDVVLDCGGVTFVNSFGMREWLRLVRALSDRGAVTFQRVADVLMTQMNLFPEFGARGRVASFHAQYVCPRCGAESAPLIDAAAHAEALAALRPPPIPCGECGAAMELADFPEKYLSIFRAT